MPQLLLLTGAGFSRNWGAWLGSEVFEYLLAEPLSGQVLDALWQAHQAKKGFETALGDLRGEERKELETAIVGMLHHLDQLLTRTEGTFPVLVVRFLARFDAIFTLNFDLLLERHYLDRVAPDPRWIGAAVPGVKPMSDPPPLQTRWSVRQQPIAEHLFRTGLTDRVQPYFKLHGSGNWHSPEGSLVIMGGDKPAAISRHPILEWNRAQFVERLARPETRLMVIGYSFSDTHINDLILAAATRWDHPIKLFIVDPEGVDVLDKRHPRALIQERPELQNALRPALIGSSRRRLRDTLEEEDWVESGKLMRFFQ